MIYTQLDPNHRASVYQENIYKACIETNSNLSVVATAGSGKTTTLMNLLKLFPKFKKTILLSFSNATVNEAAKRAPQGIRVSTLHSLGSSYMYAAYPGITMNPNKYFNKALYSFKTRTKDTFKTCYAIQDICNFIRMTMTPLKFKEVEQLCDYYELSGLEANINLAIDLVKGDKVPREMDFADMIYFPAKDEFIIQEKFYQVCIDESQDLNLAQIQFVKNLVHKNGRIISVGDPKQAIYSFTGADINSFKKLAELENTISLPLSISYRCAKRIVEEAKKIFDDIEASPNANEGEVRTGFIHEVEEGNMVLARNNAPLLEMYFYFIENDMKANIVGKEIQEDIMKIVNECLSPIKDKFETKLYDKLNTEEDRLKARGVSKPRNHVKYISLEEKIELILTILNKVNSPKDIENKLNEIFVEDTDGVKLMTIHKSKGLENEKVFFLQKFKGKQLLPSPHATTTWQRKQEQNLEFVAVTRAKNSLIYFDFAGIE